MDIETFKPELEADRKIDPNQLDVEVTRQPEMFSKWAERAIFAQYQLEKFEFTVEVLKAQLNIEARENPQRFGIANVTEAAVKAAVDRYPRYIREVEKYFELRHLSVWLGKAVEAIEIRKRMLESLIKLHGQQYFAGPSLPRDLAALWEKYNLSRNENLSEKIQRNQKPRKRVSNHES